MREYDWDFGFGFGRRYEAHPGGYDRGFEGDPYRSRAYGRSQARRGYHRADYGDDYLAFGGPYGGRTPRHLFPGMRGWSRGASNRGYAPGGRQSRSADYPQGGWRRRPGGYDSPQGAPGPREYDETYAEAPFLPERAYRRHPELEYLGAHRLDRWPMGRQSMTRGAVPDDAEIEQAVRQNLYQDNWIDADRIEIDVSDGVVTLHGDVNDYLEARYAWDDTWEVEGVRGVLNQLTIRTDQPSAAPGQFSQTAVGTPESTNGES